MGVKGCWTCRRRKIRCDGREPACDNCKKSQNVCRGYGIELSWPRDGDKRRSIVARNAGRTTKHMGKPARFLNVYHWDIALASTLEARGNIADRFGTMAPLPQRSLQPYKMSASNAYLFEFFLEFRSMLLAPIVNVPLTDFILQVAFSDPSPASNLVFHAVLAIASLRLQGHSCGLHHKARAVSMLRKSITNLDRQSVITNLTAIMALYQYELFQTAISSPDWATHLCGAKRLINAAHAANLLRHSEDSLLLDWVYYHEVSSEFSLRHWTVPKQIARVCEEEPRAQPPRWPSQPALMSERSSSFNDALGLLTLACRATATWKNQKQAPKKQQDMEQIESLVGSIYNSIGEDGPCYDVSETHFNRCDMITLLHQIASLIYYHREILDAAETFQHRRLVREGMLLLKALGSCESALPLFILACEAGNDSQRLNILDVFDRTQKSADQRSSHIAAIRKLTVAVWNQKDLNVGNEVSHSEIIDAVVSTSGFLPLFA